TEQGKKFALEYFKRQAVDRGSAGEMLAHFFEPHQRPRVGRRPWRKLSLGGEGVLAVGRPGLHAVTLQHDPEKVQTFRTRSCVKTKNWSKVAIQSEATLR